MGTWGSDAYWRPDWWGIMTPAWAHAHDVRPEQSKPVCGDAWKATYGTPMTLWAAAMAMPALPDGGGGMGMLAPLLKTLPPPPRGPGPEAPLLAADAAARAAAAARVWASSAWRSAS